MKLNHNPNALKINPENYSAVELKEGLEVSRNYDNALPISFPPTGYKFVRHTFLGVWYLKKR